MGRDISTVNQNNLWGKQASGGLGLEPQRNDLYFVDFRNAVKNVAVASRIQLPDIVPQYVRSIALPEFRTKAEPVRRDSIPFNMPSWDDPLDGIKIVFLLDTKNLDDSSAVTKFLDAWLNLTRAGRGSRNQGYSALGNWLKLNSDYRVDFQFNFNLYLLRGAEATSGGFVNTGLDDDAFRRYTAQANIAFRNQSQRTGLMQTGPGGGAQPTTSPAATFDATNEGSAVQQNLVIHSTYVLYQAWLASYKISDLSYTDSALVTVDTTFYADAIELSEVPQIFGEATKVS